MFKVEKTEYINKTFRMPKDLITELSELAQKKGYFTQSVNNSMLPLLA